jgi:PAS domain S-box-containing protein
MATSKATRRELLEELADLHTRLEESEETLRAIRHGEVDALLISGPEGDQVFTLKGADHSYRILVETINEGAATLASDGRIIYANRKLAAMLQSPLERLIGSSISDFVAPGDGEMFEALLNQGKQGDSKGEVRLQTAAGTAVPVYISLSSLQLESLPDTGCLAVTDLREQKRQEEILAAGRLFQNVLDQAEHVIIVCDAKGTITQASRAALDLAAQNPLLRPFAEAFPLLYKPVQSSTQPAFSLQAVLNGNIFRGIEAGFRRTDAREFHLILNAGPLHGETGAVAGAVITLTDITARKQAEETLERAHGWLEQRVQEPTNDLRFTVDQLQREVIERQRAEEILRESEQKLRYLTSQILTAQEDERKRISQELHDDLGQSLTALKLQLRFVQKQLPQELWQLKEEFEQVLHQLNGLIENVRRISPDLSPSILENCGMQDALRSLCKEFDKYQGSRETLQMDDIEQLFSLQGQTNIYRIFQESLNNIVKHSQATKVSVTIRKQDHCASFSIADNGVGFDVEQALSSGISERGMGLASIKERINMIGGVLKVLSQKGAGTSINFSVPFSEATEVLTPTNP